MNPGPGGVQALEQAIETWYQDSSAMLAAENEEIMQRLRCIETLLLEGESVPTLLKFLSAPLSLHSLPAPSAGLPLPSSYALPTTVCEGEGEENNGADGRTEVLPSLSRNAEKMPPQTKWRKGGDAVVGYPFQLYDTPPKIGDLERVSLVPPFVPSLPEDTLWVSPPSARNGLNAVSEKNEWYPPMSRHHNIVVYPVDAVTLSTPTTSTTTNSSILPSRSLTPLPIFSSSGGGLRLPAPSFSPFFTPYPESSLFPFPAEDEVCRPFGTSQHLERPMFSAPPLLLFRVVVQFKLFRDTFLCSHDGFAPDEYVVVSGDRGKNIGKVVELLYDNTQSHRFSKGDSFSSSRGKNGAECEKIVLRRATMSEVEFLLGDQRIAEQKALALAQILVQHPMFGLYDTMVLVGAEYQFDRRKLTFYYESAVRPDFRQVIRELYQHFHARIWMEKMKPIE